MSNLSVVIRQAPVSDKSRSLAGSQIRPSVCVKRTSYIIHRHADGGPAVNSLARRKGSDRHMPEEPA